MTKYKDEAKKKITSSLSSISSLAKKFTNEDDQVSNRKETDPLRVALLCPYSMSIPGGVQNQVLLLAAQMRSQGVDARIIAPCDGMPPNPYTISVGATRSLKSNGSVVPIAGEAQSASLTLDALAHFNPDVLHLHEPLVPGPTTSAMIGADGAMVATFHAAGDGDQVLRYLRHPARGAISRVHKRICVSAEARARAEQYLPGEYDIVPNCVDVTEIEKAEKWPATKPVVLFVGRHEERKGLRFLIDAWQGSSYCNNNAELWIAGSGEETAELVADTKDNKSIHFLGRIEYSELFRRMRTAAVVVAPALYGESFGIVLTEAMAANACVVASDIPGYRDVARDKIEALLVKPGDSVALRSSIESILEDETLRKKLQAAGKLRCAEFSVEKVTASYLDIYAQALAAHKAK